MCQPEVTLKVQASYGEEKYEIELESDNPSKQIYSDLKRQLIQIADINIAKALVEDDYDKVLLMKNTNASSEIIETLADELLNGIERSRWIPADVNFLLQHQLITGKKLDEFAKLFVMLAKNMKKRKDRIMYSNIIGYLNTIINNKQTLQQTKAFIISNMC
ncbi:MAG: hypothetical protein IKF83_04860 [Clostridia bacterium]|nr:hypothetical protein [Clostridia bacterium]